jgi:hypothetical protein
MKKIRTVLTFENEFFERPPLTIGVDPGDRWSFY